MSRLAPHGLPRRKNLGTRMLICPWRGTIPEQPLASFVEFVPDLGRFEQGRLGVVVHRSHMPFEIGPKLLHGLDSEQARIGDGKQEGASLGERITPLAGIDALRYIDP